MLAPPPHFVPFDPEKEVTIYQRNLPHWRQTGATYFVTFRLADSLPKSVSEGLRREAVERASATSDERERAWFREFDRELDSGHGSCLLGQVHERQIVSRALHHFNDPEADELRDRSQKEIRYRMGSFVIMGNHVHLLIQPIDPERYPLEKILGNLKSYSSTMINRRLGTPGERLWAEESYDRIVRSVSELNRTLQYIGRNPAKAGLYEGQSERWVSPQWKAAGWKFRGNQ